MISRETVFEIHRLNDEGYKKRKIARLLGIGRNTVGRYLKDPDRVFRKQSNRISKLDPFKDSIKEYLEKDSEVSAMVIWDKIKEKGYVGGKTILVNYLRQIRGTIKAKKAFIRYESDPGQQIQVDWGHFGSIDYEGTKRKLYALLVIESYSRMLYVEYTHSQRQEALHGALLNAFKYFGGTPKSILVDNMVTAVIDRQSTLIRFNDAFLDFLRPYHIVPKACNIRSPESKGKIEASVKYLRRNFMPLREFSDLTDVQIQVLDWLDKTANVRMHQTTGESPKEKFKNVVLRPLPDLINEPTECNILKVHKDFAIKFDGNQYTTPPWTIGKKLTVKADQYSVWIYHKEKQICSYQRCWQRKKRIENPSHTQQVKKLKRKQWENKEIALFASLGEEFREYLEQLPKSNFSLKKQITNLLALKDQYGIKSLSWAILKALKYKAYGADYIENILYQEMTPINNHLPVKLKKEGLNRIRLAEPTLNDYDAIVLKRRRKR